MDYYIIYINIKNNNTLVNININIKSSIFLSYFKAIDNKIIRDYQMIHN